MIRALALTTLLTAIVAPRALAQDLDAARARYESGDFPGAIADLDRAEREGSLTADELIALHELRVLAHRALGDEAAADRALRTIAALRPDHTLSEEFPPVVRDRFRVFARASSGPPRIAVDVVPREGGVSIAARVEGDDESLATALRLRARTAGGAWIEGSDAIEVPAGEGAHLEWDARAIGPAQAVIAEARGEHDVPTVDRGGDAWPWIAAGGGVLVVAAVVVIAVVAASGVDTRVDGPVLAELRF